MKAYSIEHVEEKTEGNLVDVVDWTVQATSAESALRQFVTESGLDGTMHFENGVAEFDADGKTYRAWRDLTDGKGI